MKKLLSDKDASFDMTYVREEESDSKSVEEHKMYIENPRKWIKKKKKKTMDLSKNGMF